MSLLNPYKVIKICRERCHILTRAYKPTIRIVARAAVFVPVPGQTPSQDPYGRMEIYYLVDTKTPSPTRVKDPALPPKWEPWAVGRKLASRCAWRYAKTFELDPTDQQEWLDDQNECFFVTLANSTPVWTRFIPRGQISGLDAACSLACLHQRQMEQYAPFLLERLAIAVRSKYETTAKEQCRLRIGSPVYTHYLDNTYPPEDAGLTVLVGKAFCIQDDGAMTIWWFIMGTEVRGLPGKWLLESDCQVQPALRHINHALHLRGLERLDMLDPFWVSWLKGVLTPEIRDMAEDRLYQVVNEYYGQSSSP